MTDTSNSRNTYSTHDNAGNRYGKLKKKSAKVGTGYPVSLDPTTMTTPNTSMSVDELLKAYGTKVIEYFLDKSDDDGWDEAKQAIEQYALNKQVELINRFEQSINQHTTPEGSDLLTRSYVRNTIDFERHRITQLEKQLKTEGDE